MTRMIRVDSSPLGSVCQHLGKTKSDLPILAADTFRHMYMFKNFKRIHRPNVLEDFVDDVLSGRLVLRPHDQRVGTGC